MMPISLLDDEAAAPIHTKKLNHDAKKAERSVLAEWVGPAVRQGVDLSELQGKSYLVDAIKSFQRKDSHSGYPPKIINFVKIAERIIQEQDERFRSGKEGLPEGGVLIYNERQQTLLDKAKEVQALRDSWEQTCIRVDSDREERFGEAYTMYNNLRKCDPILAEVLYEEAVGNRNYEERVALEKKLNDGVVPNLTIANPLATRLLAFARKDVNARLKESEELQTCRAAMLKAFDELVALSPEALLPEEDRKILKAPYRSSNVLKTDTRSGGFINDSSQYSDALPINFYESVKNFYANKGYDIIPSMRNLAASGELNIPYHQQLQDRIEDVIGAGLKR